MKKIKKPSNNILMIILIFIFVGIAYNFIADIQTTARRIPFSEFLKQIDNNQIARVALRGNLVEGQTVQGKYFDTLMPTFYPKLIDELNSKNVIIEVVPTETALGSFIGMIIQWMPGILLIGVLFYFMKNLQGGNRVMGFGKSKARMMSENTVKITFKEVAGIEEAKIELEEIVDFLKEPQKFKRLGGKIPRGCLLVGSPGTGKTLLAKAIAGEAGVPFFSISGSDFVEMFVGVGASRVRDMFSQAKKHAPCIVFIDEIDAVGRKRGTGLGGGNDEREQTLNQLLVEMDGFHDNEGVIVIAATNRPDVLDQALLRPGRFDRQVVVPMPDIKGRKEILEVHTKKVPLGDDVIIDTIARGTPGFAGADLANLVNEAALLAARNNQKYVNMAEFESAKDKLLMGIERKSMIMSDDEKLLTAYHEAGHALVSLYDPGSDPLLKVSIIPRGRALGVTMRLPLDDRYSVNITKLKADIAVAMGGRVAEEEMLGYEQVTTGAQNDIKVATSLARKMICEWGLSSKIGPIAVTSRDDHFLHNDGNGLLNASEKTVQVVDKEIHTLVMEGYNTAKKILLEHRDQLIKLAQALLEKETMHVDEIKELIGFKAIQT